MIKVNLAKSLPLGGGGPIEAGDAFQMGEKDVQRQGVMRLLIIFICPMALFAYEFQNIPDLQSKLTSRNAILRSLIEKNEQAKGAVLEIEKFKQDQARLQKQIDTLEGLQKERLREVKIMDNLQKDIPEKVWLTRMEFLDKNLKLSGVATADTEISNFMENLGRSVFLKEVNLIKSTDEAAEKSILKIFEITCEIDRPVLNEVRK
jgi:type IV pilus assembly protein PilN